LKKSFELEKQKANEFSMNYFLENLINNTDLLEENYNFDLVKDLRLQLKQLKIN
jgi:hypothetical protein